MSGAREQGLIPNTSTRCARRFDDCEPFWAQSERCSIPGGSAGSGPRYLKLLDRLDNAVEYPRVVTAKLSLPAIAAGQFRKLRKAVKALPEAPSNDDLHAVRIRVKRARYAAELAQTLVGRPAKQFV